MSSKIVLYTTRRTPGGRAVQITSHILGLNVDLKYVDLSKKEQMSEDYLKMNPFHTVPTITDAGVPVYDSHAILVYLVSKYGKDDSLYPKDLVTQARINAWLHFDSSILFPRLRGALEPVFYFGATEIPQARLEAIEKAYELLEGALKSDFLVGDSMTLADISVTTSLASLNGVFPMCEGKFPKLCTFMKRMEQTMPCYKEYNADVLEETKVFLKQKLDENNKKSKQ
ncbi:glutathione S-transferase 1-like [Ochlerotatus camptorhynchus]|uniref:glutathione S-transferase 1-like n=1 Tax=Ochlerotatus camptorhynchus TaxID=644619 RepID=UPI0031D3AE1E